MLVKAEKVRTSCMFNLIYVFFLFLCDYSFAIKLNYIIIKVVAVINAILKMSLKSISLRIYFRIYLIPKLPKP